MHIVAPIRHNLSYISLQGILLCMVVTDLLDTVLTHSNDYGSNFFCFSVKFDFYKKRNPIRNVAVCRHSY